VKRITKCTKIKNKNLEAHACYTLRREDLYSIQSSQNKKELNKTKKKKQKQKTTKDCFTKLQNRT
jgi:hypothetical protein